MFSFARCLGDVAIDSIAPVWHVDLAAELGDRTVSRAYTPVSTAQDFANGVLDLLIKVYPNGVMTQHLASLKVGECIAVAKPISTLDIGFLAEGVVVIAGGSAVTLAMQVCEIVLNLEEPPEVHLLLCNKTVDDALFAERFEQLLETHPLFHVTHCISREKPHKAGRALWKQDRLNVAILRGLPQQLKTIVSGPPGLCRAAYDALWALNRLGNTLFLDELPEVSSACASKLVEGAPPKRQDRPSQAGQEVLKRAKAAMGT